MRKTTVIALSFLAVFSLAPLAVAQSYGCVSIPVSTMTGSRGTQVIDLQRFLVAQNYPGGGSWMQTGYFGQATAAAVRSFQASQGLPQLGYVDATTAAAISRMSCLPGQGGGGSYPTYPSYPSYPSYLYPTYPTYPYPNYPSYPTYPYPPINNCLSGQGNTYPYTSNNYGYNFNCPVHISSLSRTSGGVGDRITVYGSGFSPTGNTVRFGIGTAATNINASSGGTRLTFTVPTYLDIYTYGRERIHETTYPISVVSSSGYVSNQISFRVTDADNDNNGDLEITSVSGPSSLETGEEGTWTVRVGGGSSDYYTFSIDWDDDNSYPYPYNPYYPYTQAQDFFQTNSLTHTYYSSGTYDIRFTVTNDSGESDSYTKTVRVE